MSLLFDLRVEGLENISETGPLVIASRHYHYLWDGAALAAATHRPLHFLVAFDWARSRVARRALESGSRLLGWPGLIRSQSIQAGHSAYRQHEVGRYARRSWRDTLRLLERGAAVVVFPEGYPNVDPVFTVKQGGDAFLQFQPGLIRLVERAQRRGDLLVPIVPTGIRYQRGKPWRITVRFGSPRYLTSQPIGALLAEIETEVRRLSSGSEGG